MKNLLMTLALLASMTSYADSIGGSAAGSGIMSAASLMGVEGSTVGSIVIASAGIEASANAINYTYKALKYVAKKGSKLVVKSVKTSGTVVTITYEASLAGAEFASDVAGNVLEFSVEFSKEILETAGQGFEILMNAAKTGSQVAVQASAVTLGTSSRIIGYSFTLAASPLIAVGYILTELGNDIYYSSAL